jgi:glycerophosphoryl diester phosphodiesterase
MLVRTVCVFVAFLNLLATGACSEERAAVSGSSRPLVIAHRGASGYVVEHSEGAKVLAHAQGADYIEQDVVLSKDLQFVVTHDITMEETTNVEQVYPDRVRSDGKWYFADFTWDEIQGLELHERTRRDSHEPVFADRFPVGCGQRVLKLEEEIKLVQGLNKTTGKSTGLYIELKGPAFHRKEFGDRGDFHESMGRMLLELLERFPIDKNSCPCFIQCFEFGELKHLREDLKCDFPLIYLLGRSIDPKELESASKIVQGIGPSLELLAKRGDNDQVLSTGLVEQSRELGLKVHPYTIRKEMQPRWSHSLEETHRVLVDTLRVDGFFTDFPDLGRQAVDRH